MRIHPNILTPLRRRGGSLCFLAAAALLLDGTLGSRAATQVSGIVADQTWTLAGSPYQVTGDLLVASLTIQPGVEVQVHGTYTIEVAGFMNAQGTADKRILFGPGGTATGWNGIFFNEAPAGSALRHCRIEGSRLGGVRITNSLPEITHCLIVGNRSVGNGAGLSISLRTGSIAIDSCIVTNNVATGDGGGVWIAGNAVIRQSTVTHNRSANGGGVGLAGSGTLQIANSLVAHNMSTRLGGGLWGGASSQMTAVNCLVTSNRTQYGGGGRSEGRATARYLNCTVVRNEPDGLSSCGSSVAVTNSIVYQNGPGLWYAEGCEQHLSVAYSNTQGGVPEPGTGNKSSNPVLDPVTFRLLPGSPCIDAENPAAMYNDGCRPPALGGERNDMGAYGGPGGCLGVGVGGDDVDGDGLPDNWELQYFGNVQQGPLDDPDRDRLENVDEFKAGTDPGKSDTDGDGYSDFAELRSRSDPLDPKSVPPATLILTVEDVRLEFPCGLNERLVIEKSADLSNWQVAEQVVGTGDVISRIFNVSDGRRFFRVVRP